MDTRPMKAVYTILEKPGDRSFWLRIGWAWVNRDGSFNVKLDALPVNGSLQIRDYAAREELNSRPSSKEVHHEFFEHEKAV